MRAPQSTIVIAIFILFIGMHLFGHGHGGHGGRCCGPGGWHEGHREKSDNDKKD